MNSAKELPLINGKYLSNSCDNLLPKTVARKWSITDKKYALRYLCSDWWVWIKCPYILGKLARSSKEKPSISRGTVIRNLEILNRHILTFFAKSPVDGISPDSIEKWIFGLKELGLANKIINKNPMARVGPLSVDKFLRDLLTFEEASLLLEEINWANIPSTTPAAHGCGHRDAPGGNPRNHIRDVAWDTCRRSGTPTPIEAVLGPQKRRSVVL